MGLFLPTIMFNFTELTHCWKNVFFASWIILAKIFVLLTFQLFLVVHGASWSQEILFHKTDAFFADVYESIWNWLWINFHSTKEDDLSSIISILYKSVNDNLEYLKMLLLKCLGNSWKLQLKFCQCATGMKLDLILFFSQKYLHG